MLANIINQSTILETDETFLACCGDLGFKELTAGEWITNAIDKVYFNKKESFNRVSF